MKQFIFGTIFGIIIGAVGLTGIVRLLDSGIETVKTHAQEYAK